MCVCLGLTNFTIRMLMYWVYAYKFHHTMLVPAYTVCLSGIYLHMRMVKLVKHGLLQANYCGRDEAPLSKETNQKYIWPSYVQDS